MTMIAEGKMIIPKFSWSEITCGEACWRAKDSECKCSCHGKNHGIWLRGGVAERTHKHGGKLYRLIAIDTSDNILNLQKEKLVDYGLYRCYEYGGKFYHQSYIDQLRCRGDKDSPYFPLVSKKPTLSQCQQWTELSEYKALDKSAWYRLDIKLLWEVIEKPSDVKHICDGKILEGTK